ncbi:GNAT family N-acetyltransferase [Acinetobacter soli]|uniref:GNAT family N-acetyltransferase n=1 Tax=Acinetobacter soli TaxID=487316 RepID=A0A1P8EH29_9GAMM|nr:GNAT family N-acetyltransferase [Acinetobacter soli]APV35497.1 GNAT family N-acetyltransferase [Acinetobacter soli]
MTIRFVEANDFEAWLTLWKGYQEFYQSSIDDQVTRSTFSRFLSEQEPVYCLVIEDKSQKIIGFVHYIFHRSTWSEGNYCYLQDLFVDPAQRASGIGRKLIEEVYKIAEEKKCSRVYWLTQETNYLARMLYDRIADNSGFIQYRKLFH